jgi:hypothetical protein
VADLTLAEGITASFYAWETRGRGWTLAPYPVSLEPPHRPFFLLPQHAGGRFGRIDDGHRPTLLSRVVGWVLRDREDGDASDPYEEEEPYALAAQSPKVALRLWLPDGLTVRDDVSTRLLLALAASAEPLAFEIVGQAGRVGIQIVASVQDVEYVRETLRAYVPELEAVEGDDLLARWGDGDWHAALDLGLSDEFFLPIATDRRATIDPYAPLIAAMSACRAGESLTLQVIFEPVRNPWARTIVEALDDGDGGCILEDARELPRLAAQKLETPLLAAVVRFAIQAGSEERIVALARSVEAFIAQFERPKSNAFVPLSNEGYAEAAHLDGIITRTSCRTGMLLSTDELAGLVHIPAASLTHPALVRATERSRPTPGVALRDGVVLGENVYRGERTLVTLPTEDRYAHVHVIGATGTGKSTLLVNLIAQDIARRDGVAVFDPHGDLIDDVLARVPKERFDDVILFDPSDEEYPVGFGFFTANSDVERNLLASDTVAVFQRLSTSWGDSMTAVLGNAIYAMLASPTPCTLLDLRRFLIDDRFRAGLVARINDPEVSLYWSKQFPLIGSRSIGPILARLDAFLRLRLLRNIVGQRQPKLSIDDVLKGQKVLLARLPHGLIGEENAALLGSLLVTKLHQSALARQRVPKDERPAFFCYLDEFQHFVTPSIASLVNEGRKYRVGLTVAHQSLAQLTTTRIESGVLSNMHTRIVFRAGDADAKRLAEGFAHFEAKDIQALGRGEAIVRLGRAADDCIVTMSPPGPTSNDDRACEEIWERSRLRFGVPRLELEDLQRQEAQEAVSAPETVGTEKVPTVEPAPAAPVPPTPPKIETVAEPRPMPAPARRSRTDELGKGGQEHKYLQHLVKRLAEERGYRAVVEEDIGEGRSIDVLLRRDDVSIACEISVTTEIDHELGNIVKCASLGYSRILFVAASKRKRDQMLRRAAEAVPEAPIVAVAPEELVGALESFEAPATPTEATVRGYKVKVKRQAVSPGDVAARRSTVAEIIARSLSTGSRS